MLTRERGDRRVSGSSHSRRIKRTMAAQKTLWFALAPPIHEVLRACPNASRPSESRDAWRSQLLAGSGQERMTLSFKAM